MTYIAKPKFHHPALKKNDLVGGARPQGRVLVLELPWPEPDHVAVGGRHQGQPACHRLLVHVVVERDPDRGGGRDIDRAALGRVIDDLRWAAPAGRQRAQHEHHDHGRRRLRNRETTAA